MVNKKSLIVFTVISFLGLSSFYLFSFVEKQKEKDALNVLKFVRASVSQQVISEGSFPKKLIYDDSEIKVSYTINSTLQNGLQKILKRYPSDHTAVVVLDNKSGEILAAAGINRKNKKINFSLPFSTTHPSASLFKVVTTADLLENGKMLPHTKMSYRGRGTTLYKYQLKNKISRWTRWISFQKAFASSNNVIFGKAAISKSSGQSIFKTAFKFGFNKDLMNDFNLGPSRFLMPESQYHLAELASGFNKETVISPVHAASISSVIANEGNFVTPHLVNEVVLQGEKPQRFDVERKRVISEKTSADLADMMELTTKRGTARAVLRGRLGKKLAKNFIVGAKTGSITGGIPRGKRDWLILYAKPKKKAVVSTPGDQGISLAVMNINDKKWFYKSTYIAKKVLELYLKNQRTESEAAI
jgi:peptidoglycan glycosyltransferase